VNVIAIHLNAPDVLNVMMRMLSDQITMVETSIRSKRRSTAMPSSDLLS
jgi:hypothetical protein